MTTNVPFNLIHTGNNAIDDVNLVFQSASVNKFNIGYDKGDDLFVIAGGNTLDTDKVVTIKSSVSPNNLVTISGNQNNSTPILKLINNNNQSSADTAMIFENGNSKYISMGYKNYLLPDNDSFLITNNINLQSNEMLKINNDTKDISVYGNIIHEVSSDFEIKQKNSPIDIKTILKADSSGVLKELGFASGAPSTDFVLKYNGSDIVWSQVPSTSSVSITNSLATTGIATLIGERQLQAEFYLKYEYKNDGLDNNVKGSKLNITNESSNDYNRLVKFEGYNFQAGGIHTAKRANYIMGINLTSSDPNDIGKFHIGSNRTLQFTVNDNTTLFSTGNSVVNLTVNAIPLDFPNGTVFNLFSSGSNVSTSSNITFTLSSQVSQGDLSLPGTLSNNNSSSTNLNNYVGLSTYDFFDSNFKSGLSIDHTGAFQIAGLDLSEGNISNAGNINCDSITVDEAANGLTLDFAGISGTNKIKLNENLPDALNITQAGDSYMKFVTNTGSEKIMFGKNSTFTGTTIADLGTVTTADINGGTIDDTTIATSNITVGTGKTLDVSAGILTLANNQISGDKVEGGTIAEITISKLAGAINCNNQNMTNVNINSGTIDGTTIATSNITVGTGKTLDVSAGILTLANNQISGDKVEGGTIAEITISKLAGAINCNNQNMTNVNINSGTIDGTTIATSNITVGTGKTLDVSAGILTLANNQISGDKVEGGTIAEITISKLAGAINCNNQNMTNVNINSGTIDGTTIATSNITVGSEKTLDVSDGQFILNAGSVNNANATAQTLNDVITQFNLLLTSLRNAGVLA